MPTTALQTAPLPARIQPVRTITWEHFQNRYLKREDAWKYEWVGGQVVKTPRNMDKSQLFICVTLIRLLYKLKAKNPGIHGDLISEGDTFFDGNHRRPDIAFFSDEQIKSARTGGEAVPKFVVEVISKNDQLEKIAGKMKNYRAAKVEVVWQVFPIEREVHVFRGNQMTILSGDEICSAEPVIDGFLISVNDLFK